MKKLVVIIATVVAVSGIAAHAVTRFVVNQEFKNGVKKVIKDYSASIVAVKYTVSGNPQLAQFGINPNQNVSSAGIVISDDVIVTRSPDNTGQMAFMMQGQRDQQSGPKNYKVLLSDGKLLDADFLIKDKDFSLTFLKVKKESLQKEQVKLTPLNYTTSAKAEAGDFALALRRMSENLGSAPSASLVIIESEITKPIKAYGAMIGWELAPIFDLTGALIGFATTYQTGETGVQLSVQSFQTLLVPSETLKPIFEKAKEATPQSNVEEETEEEEEENVEEEED
ncbi:MAG: hypothetical protein HY606_00680 [Planctomycetes bacterium]|nr:hypothetical protein [Planctomycetota bacterium]